MTMCGSTGTTRDITRVSLPKCVRLCDVTQPVVTGALDFQMDEWRVDVAVTGSQKAMSLPTGLAYVAASKKV